MAAAHAVQDREFSKVQVRLTETTAVFEVRKLELRIKEIIRSIYSGQSSQEHNALMRLLEDYHALRKDLRLRDIVLSDDSDYLWIVRQLELLFREPSELFLG